MNSHCSFKIGVDTKATHKQRIVWLGSSLQHFDASHTHMSICKDPIGASQFKHQKRVLNLLVQSTLEERQKTKIPVTAAAEKLFKKPLIPIYTQVSLGQPRSFADVDASVKAYPSHAKLGKPAMSRPARKWLWDYD